MRKFTLVLMLAFVTFITGVTQAQQTTTTFARYAADFNQWVLPSVTANTYQFPATLSCIIDPYNSKSFGFATTAPVQINDLGTPSNSEIVTPSTVELGSPQGTCGFSATFAHSHASFLVSSGTAGLQEAINATHGGTSSNPAVIILDAKWYAQVANLVGAPSGASLLAAATGNAEVNLVDVTQAPWVSYTSSGGGYTAATAPVPTFAAAGNGSSWTYFSSNSLVTLATGGTTTDTSTNVLPANSVIDMVQGVVNTTITGSCTGWELGDATTAARFSANNTGLTAGTAANGTVAITTGIASATTGIYQTSAAKVRITCAGGDPTAGKIRVIVYGRTFTPPTT